MNTKKRFEFKSKNLIPVFSGLASFAIGIFALAGWTFGVPVMVSFNSEWIPMAPSTAILLSLLSAAILALQFRPESEKILKLCRAAAYSVAAASLLLLITSSIGVYSNIEHLFWKILPIAGNVQTGHMSPVTAACFFLGSTALIFYMSPSAGYYSGISSLFAAALLCGICFLFMLVYTFGPPMLYDGMIIPPAANTVIGLLLYGVSIFSIAFGKILADRGHDEEFAEEHAASLFIFAVLSIGIAYCGFFYYSSYEKYFRAELEKQLSAIAELKSSQIALWHRERTGNAEALKNNPMLGEKMIKFFASPEKKHLRGSLREYFDNYRSSYEYERVIAADNDLANLLAVPDGNSIPPEILASARETAASGKIKFTDFYRDGFSGKIYLAFVIPMQDGGFLKNPAGVIITIINPEKRLYPFIARWPSHARSAETVLVRREGDRVVFLNELKFKKDAALKFSFPLAEKALPAARALSGIKGTLEGVDYRGVKVIADVRPIPNTPWHMINKIDVSEVYGPLREHLVMMFFFAGFILAVSGLGLNLMWSRRTADYYMRGLAAEREKAWLRDIIERSLNEIFVFDSATLKFKYVNTGARRNIGYSMEELNQMTPFDIKPEYNEESFKKAISPLIKKEKETLIFETVHRRKDGTDYAVEIHLQLIDLAEQSLFLAIINDITRRKEIEKNIYELNATLEKKVAERTAQLEDSNRELEAFAYSVSHDLRAPLRAIDGFSKFLAEDYADRLDGEGKRLIGVVRSNTQKMDQLISDLLSLSRIGRSEINRMDIEMKKIVEQVYNECIPGEVKKIFEFSAGDLADARGDLNLIRQVWTNLIANAVKYSMKSSVKKIEAGSRAGNGETVYFIKDAGAGFKQEYAGKLFGVFQRLHKTEEFEGNGVGLAIVQRIIHRHGGRVWAEGRENEGAVFYFTLPLKES